MRAATPIDREDWLLLILLSVLWGGAFFFTGVAVKELPPLTIVLVRVALASALLAPVMLIWGGAFPSELRGWFQFFVMALLTNVIPFSLLDQDRQQSCIGVERDHTAIHGAGDGGLQ